MHKTEEHNEAVKEVATLKQELEQKTVSSLRTVIIYTRDIISHVACWTCPLLAEYVYMA